jgi:hypothetical protein
LFDVLKGIPQDGTFDQHKPLKDLCSRNGKKGLYYSFDLSAATDRLPIDIQEDILKILSIPYSSE